MKLILLLMLLTLIGLVSAEPLLVKEGTLSTDESKLDIVKKANPLIGILIMFVINTMGLGVYAIKMGWLL